MLLVQYEINVIEVPTLATMLHGVHAMFPYTKSYEEAHADPILALHTSGSTGDRCRLQWLIAKLMHRQAHPKR